jgi:glyoxylase-like metal-dependent hydrolase (beta-lactamase superfamily II)
MATLTHSRKHDAAGARAPAQSGVYPTRVGELDCLIVSDGHLPSDASRLAVDVDVQEVVSFLAGRGIDVRQLITQLSCLLVRNHPVGGVVLVDGGIGTLPVAGGHPVPTAGHLRANLAAAGVSAEAVETVLVSHLHPDHIGGLFDDDDRPAYPNATYHVPSTEAKFWSQDEPDLSGQLAPPGMREGEVAFAQRFLSLASPRTRFFTPGDTVMEGVESRSLPGHAPGQAGFVFGVGEDSLFYTADVAGHPIVSVEHPEWRFALDMDAELAKATRRQLIDDLRESRQRFLSAHFPFPNLGRVGTHGGSAVWMPEPYRWS